MAGFVPGPLNGRGGGSNVGVSRFGLVCPDLSFFVLLGTFPIFAGFSRFVLFLLNSRPRNGTYEEQFRKGPQHHPDLSRRKSGRFSFSQVYVFHHNSTIPCFGPKWHSQTFRRPDKRTYTSSSGPQVSYRLVVPKWLPPSLARAGASSFMLQASDSSLRLVCKRCWSFMGFVSIDATLIIDDQPQFSVVQAVGERTAYFQRTAKGASGKGPRQKT